MAPPYLGSARPSGAGQRCRPCGAPVLASQRDPQRSSCSEIIFHFYWGRLAARRCTCRGASPCCSPAAAGWRVTALACAHSARSTFRAAREEWHEQPPPPRRRTTPPHHAAAPRRHAPLRARELGPVWGVDQPYTTLSGPPSPPGPSPAVSPVPRAASGGLRPGFARLRDTRESAQDWSDRFRVRCSAPLPPPPPLA